MQGFFIYYTTHMKKLLSIFCLFTLVLYNNLFGICYSNNNQEAIDILNSILYENELTINNTESTPDDCFVFSSWVILHYNQDSDVDGENVRCWANVVIPDQIWWEDVIEIWAQAFATIYLDNVVLPKNLQIIWTWAFRWRSWWRNSWHSLTNIVFPEKLTTICENAFNYQTLVNITFPESLEYVWKQAFFQNETIKTIKFPSQMEYIWDYAFEYAWIENLNVNSKYIWKEAFRDCIDLVNVNIWDYTEIIDEGAFKFSKKIDTIKIWDGLRTIWAYWFYCNNSDNHSSIKNIELPENMTYLWNRAFTNCWLTSVEIPKSVQYIWEYSFWNNLLTSFKILWNNVILWNWSSVVGSNKNLSILDIAWWIETITNNFANSLNPYWDVPLTIKIWSWTKYIEDWAFGWSYSIVSKIELPDTLISIWKYWFWYNIAEDTIYIPSSVTNIWEYAFHNRNGSDVSCVIAWWTQNKTVANNMCTYIYTWYTVKYDLNWWQSMDIKNQIVKLWESTIIWNNTILNTWYDFVGWSRDVLADGEVYSIWDYVNYENDWTYELNLYAHWKSLEEKVQETTTENVVYTNTTTVTVWEETTDETLSWSSTLTLVSKEVEDKEVKKEEETTKVQDSEIKVTSDKTVEYEWWLEVYLEKTENVGTENETTWKVEWIIKFSAPVAVKIPVSSDVEYVKVQVKHGDEAFGFKWLTLKPVNECNNWEAVNDKYNWEDVLVTWNTNKYATIYTCSASTFVAYTENIKPVIPQPSAWGGRTVATKQETKAEEQEHNSADTVESEINTQTPERSTNTVTVKDQVKKIEWRELTRWEVAIMTNILLEVYPQLVEWKAELEDVTNACSNYADEQNFTMDEKKAITRLCKLSIMWIHNDTNKPLEEFLVNNKSTNDEFSKVINRSVATYNEKDLSTIKDALKKLEWDEENVVFGTVYDMFMSIKSLFN